MRLVERNLLRARDLIQGGSRARTRENFATGSLFNIFKAPLLATEFPLVARRLRFAQECR